MLNNNYQPINIDKAMQILDSSQAKNYHIFYQDESNNLQRICFIIKNKRDPTKIMLLLGDSFSKDNVIHTHSGTKFFSLKVKVAENHFP